MLSASDVLQSADRHRDRCHDALELECGRRAFGTDRVYVGITDQQFGTESTVGSFDTCIGNGIRSGDTRKSEIRLVAGSDGVNGVVSRLDRERT